MSGIGMREELSLTVERLGARGDGLARWQGQTLYLTGAVPGDRVRVRIDQGKRGPIVTGWDLEAPSDQRVAPRCRHFGRCGGCTLQHLDDASYRGFLTDKIAAALHQHGLQAEMLAPAVSPPGSRRRLVLHARPRGQAVLLGFFEARSRQLVDVEMCPVARPDLVALLPGLRRVLAGLLHPSATATLTLTATDTGVDLAMALPQPPDLAAREALAAFAESADLAAVSWDWDGAWEPIAQRRVPQMSFGRARVGLPAGSFLQATAEGEAALRDAVLATAGAGPAMDLFAGLGTFSFPLAETRPVTAVEGAGPAVQALAKAARTTAGLKPVTAVHRDLFRRPMTPEELRGFDTVVLDPPRPGAKAQAEQLARSSVPHVVAISCNPATFARDVAILVAGGYRLGPIRPVGQFLWSSHVELAASLCRR